MEESQIDEEELKASEEPVKNILMRLAHLQREYANQEFDDIPEDVQQEIKDLQRELNKFNPKLV